MPPQNTLAISIWFAKICNQRADACQKRDADKKPKMKVAWARSEAAIEKFQDELSRLRDLGDPLPEGVKFNEDVANDFFDAIKNEYQKDNLKDYNYHPMADLEELELLLEPTPPTAQENFRRLLKKTLALGDEKFKVSSSNIIIDMSAKEGVRELRTLALVEVLTAAKFNCEQMLDEDDDPIERVKVKLPIRDSFSLPIQKEGSQEKITTLSLRGDQKETLQYFRQYFQDHYITVVADNPEKQKAPPEDPLFSKLQIVKEKEFLLNMQQLQPLLVKLLDPDSPETTWVKQSQHLSKLEELTNDMLEKFKPFRPLSEHVDPLVKQEENYNPPGRISYEMALRNLKDNPTMMLNLMRENPEVFKKLRKNMKLLHSINDDYNAYTARNRPAPVAPFEETKSKEKEKAKAEMAPEEHVPPPKTPGRPE